MKALLGGPPSPSWLTYGPLSAAAVPVAGQLVQGGRGVRRGALTAALAHPIRRPPIPRGLREQGSWQSRRAAAPQKHSPVGSQAQAIVRERWACAVAYQLL